MLWGKAYEKPLTSWRRGTPMLKAVTAHSSIFLQRQRALDATLSSEEWRRHQLATSEQCPPRQGQEAPSLLSSASPSTSDEIVFPAGFRFRPQMAVL